MVESVGIVGVAVLNVPLFTEKILVTLVVCLQCRCCW
jgi:hypothetical protein